MRLLSRTGNERGVALVVALMATLVIVGLMAGAFAAINADQRLISIDRDQTQAYAAAHAGLEKLTSDLASLFTTNVSPTVTQITELTTHPPDLAGFHFIDPADTPVAEETATSGYRITWNGSPNPTPIPDGTITAGPYQGLKGMITPYTITVTARSAAGGAEVRLRRELQTVAVPVFQFGVFSQGDLTFYAGQNFNFGGRVHTNGSLFLSQASGATLTFRDKITAVNNVVRSHLSNDEPVANVAFTGTVSVIKTFPATFDTMGPLDDSVKGSPPGWTQNTNEGSTTVKGWTNISNIKFNGNIKNSLTGARALNLPLVQDGGQPIDLIRRPATNTEDTTNSALFGQRFFTTSGLRILLSDRDTDITNMPGVSVGAPIRLRNNWITTPPAGYGAIGANRPPVALSMGPLNPIVGGAAHTISAIGGGASPTMSITLNAAPLFPTQFILQPINVMKADGTFHVMTCGGKTLTTFTNCLPVLPENIPAGRAVWMDHLNGSRASTFSANPSVAGSGTLTVMGDQPSNFGTTTFSPIFFWTHNPGNAQSTDSPTAVSCTGYNLAARRFDGCAWWGTGPAQNTGGATNMGATPVVGHEVRSWAHSGIDQPLIDGFIKIERRQITGLWVDVTAEILNFGIGERNQDGPVCADPTPNAILRLQRLKDNAFPAASYPAANTCPNLNSTNPYDWWPNTLYDAREGILRDVTTTTRLLEMGGVMQYITLDVNNLRLWLNGTLPGTGNTVLRDNGGIGGYIVYFSDRRGDHRDVAGEPETGEYGFEDIVNRNQTDGAPNGALDIGEDMNGNGILDLYGAAGAMSATVLPANPTVPFTNATTHRTNLTHAQARTNKVVLFRRALKLANGGISGGGFNNMPTPGLTVAAENPVYVQGNYNANTNPNLNPDNNGTQPNVPAAILADAVTLLSNNWRDTWSFRSNGNFLGAAPHDQTARPAVTTGYRFAVISGKGLSFPFNGTARPAGTIALFGTDGGVGNFLRLLEDWQTPNASINYRGSVVSLFTSRQATGTFKWGPNVYVFNTRNFVFDNDFLQPALLPPGTPMFRDINTLNFRQVLRPNQ